MIWSFPSTPLVNEFWLPKSTVLAVTTHCCWIRPEGFLHLDSVTLLLNFWGCAKCSSLPFAFKLSWAHGIWLKTLHGNTVSKLPLSQITADFSYRLSVSFGSISQRLNIMIHLYPPSLRERLWKKCKDIHKFCGLPKTTVFTSPIQILKKYIYTCRYAYIYMYLHMQTDPCRMTLIKS